MPDGPLHRRLEDVPLVDEPANDVQMRAMLTVADSPADLSVVWVRITGHHQRLRTDASTRLYIVLEGTGTITVGDEPLEVAAGDLVVIPPSTPYHLDGELTYLVCNQPGFREGDDLYLGPDGEVVGTEPPPKATSHPEEA